VLRFRTFQRGYRRAGGNSQKEPTLEGSATQGNIRRDRSVAAILTQGSPLSLASGARGAGTLSPWDQAFRPWPLPLSSSLTGGPRGAFTCCWGYSLSLTWLRTMEPAAAAW
jgi:hypothetical protein